MKKAIFNIHVFVATAFIMAFTSLLRSCAISAESLKPIAQAAQDFEYTDLVFKYRSTQPPSYSPVVIVDLPKLHKSEPEENIRAEIAAEIDTIFHYSPKLVALDLRFKDRQDTAGNSYLVRVCSDPAKRDKIVLSGFLDYPGGDKPLRLNKSFAAVDTVTHWGYANFLGEKNRTIRRFKPFVYEKGIGEINSFPAEIVKLADTAAYNYMTRRSCKTDTTEYINYTQNQYQFIPHYSAKLVAAGGDTLNSVRDKIVMIGSTDSTILEDMIFTPFNRQVVGRTFPDMNGIFVQANAVLTMLNKRYINEIPAYFEWSVAIIIAYVFAVFYFYLEHKPYHAVFHLLGKILQILLLAVLLIFEVNLLKHFEKKFNDYYVLATLILVTDILVFYSALKYAISKVIEKFVKSA